MSNALPVDTRSTLIAPEPAISDRDESAIVEKKSSASLVSSSVRIPALDGLRGLAILLVLLWHSIFHSSFNHYPGLNRLIGIGRLSWSGVDLFFVLSGFLIGGILLDNRDSPHFFKTFYLRRAYRILPLYFVVVTLCWLAFQANSHGIILHGPVNLLQGRVPWWSFFTFTQNLWMAGTGGFSRAGLGVTWSLAIEEQFYLTLPFIIRFLAPKKLVYLIAGVVLGAPLLRALLIHFWSGGAFASYVLMPTRADALGLGVLCAVLVRNKAVWDYLLTHRAWIYSASGVLLGCVIAIISRGYPLFPENLLGAEYSVLAFFYAFVLLVAITGGDDRLVKALFCNKLLTKLGLIAYGTYLLHYLSIDVVHFLLTYHNPRPSAVALLGAPVLGIVVALAVAQISWQVFEKPLVRRAHAFHY